MTESAVDTTPPPSDPLGELVALLRDIRDRIDAGQAEALDATEAGRLCGMGNSTWRERSDRGLTPAPVFVTDRAPRWLRSELLAWLRAGCPARARWESMKSTRMRPTG